MTPAVSVLMAVHNDERWLTESVQSILTQTLTDLELIVVDDGSTDQTPQLLAAIHDPRLRVERRDWMGLTSSLNHALFLARAPLLARLDADDTSVPERLARQKAFLDQHPGVGVLGSAAREIDANGHHARFVRPPTNDAAIRRKLIRKNPFIHPSVMMRRSLVERVHGYDPTLPYAQDYDLWMRLSQITQLANLPDVLVERRVIPKRDKPERDDEQLRVEEHVRRWAVRKGIYSRWYLVFAWRAALARKLPPDLRRGVRYVIGSRSR